MEGVNIGIAALKEARCWRGFEQGRWASVVDVRDFIVRSVDTSGNPWRRGA